VGFCITGGWRGRLVVSKFPEVEFLDGIGLMKTGSCGDGADEERVTQTAHACRLFRKMVSIMLGKLGRNAIEGIGGITLMDWDSIKVDDEVKRFRQEGILQRQPVWLSGRLPLLDLLEAEGFHLDVSTFSRYSSWVVQICFIYMYVYF
jgi:hypothetical protein